MSNRLASKQDIVKLEKVFKQDIAKLDKEILLVKWMVGLVLSGIFALILKSFF